MSKLALLGGEKTIADGVIKNWPPIDDTDIASVVNSLKGGNHAFGENFKAYEEEFAKWNGNKYARPTNSGTAALHMCIAGCGCSCGDEVIVAAYSWSSSATCILHHNCIPIFVDIDYKTINMDINKIEAVITPRTKAIICIHLHGLPMEMDPVMKIAKKYNLKVIEDCCQAHGAKYKGVKVGNIGDCAAFSSNQNKCLCTGEGGVFVTNDKDIFDKASLLWSFGETKAPHESRDYHVYALGWMYTPNDITCAFGRSQLAKLTGYQETLHENAMTLENELKGVDGLILPYIPKDCESNYYNYTLRLDADKFGYGDRKVAFRDKVLEALIAEGTQIGIWQHFILPKMTVFLAQNAYGSGCPWSCPNATNVKPYIPEDYPMAQLHCDTHFGLTQPLRAPNTPDVARLVGKAIKKVLENVKDLNI